MIRDGLFASRQGRGSLHSERRRSAARCCRTKMVWRGGVELNCPMDGATQAREPATEIAGGELKSRF